MRNNQKMPIMELTHSRNKPKISFWRSDQALAAQQRHVQNLEQKTGTLRQNRQREVRETIGTSLGPRVRCMIKQRQRYDKT